MNALPGDIVAMPRYRPVWYRALWSATMTVLIAAGLGAGLGITLPLAVAWLGNACKAYAGFNF